MVCFGLVFVRVSACQHRCIVPEDEAQDPAARGACSLITDSSAPANLVVRVSACEHRCIDHENEARDPTARGARSLITDSRVESKLLVWKEVSARKHHCLDPQDEAQDPTAGGACTFIIDLSSLYRNVFVRVSELCNTPYPPHQE